uniref:Uncharacterized protein n=1 Tax=Panagrolaimus sp. ES5 TaxID=591445 RepID=A0AC34GET7_9BILA
FFVVAVVVVVEVFSCSLVGMDTAFEDCVGAVEAFEVVVVEEGTVYFKVVDEIFGLLFRVVSGIGAMVFADVRGVMVDAGKEAEVVLTVEDETEVDFVVVEDDDTTVLAFVVSSKLGVVKCVETMLSGIVVVREVMPPSEVCSDAVVVLTFSLVVEVVADP